MAARRRTVEIHLPGLFRSQEVLLVAMGACLGRRWALGFAHAMESFFACALWFSEPFGRGGEEVGQGGGEVLGMGTHLAHRHLTSTANLQTSGQYTSIPPKKRTLWVRRSFREKLGLPSTVISTAL